MFRRRPTEEGAVPEPPIAAEIGALPAGDSATVIGVSLPVGHVVRLEEPDQPGGPRDAMWRTEQTVATSLWRELLLRFPKTGLWPVLLDPNDRHDVMHDGPAPPYESDRIEQASPEDVLSELWPWNDRPADAEELEWMRQVTEPYGPAFTGLASNRAPLRDSAIEQTLEYLDANESRSLALVPVIRGADVPVALGWYGAVNHTNDIWKISVVLRSWEERFGALLLGLGFDTMTVIVRRPPSPEQALAVAAEHYAFCPDNIDQSETPSLPEYAELLARSPAWHFWWD